MKYFGSFMVLALSALIYAGCGSSNNNNQPACGAGYVAQNGTCVPVAGYPGVQNTASCQGTCQPGSVQTASFGCQPVSPNCGPCGAFVNNTCVQGYYGGTPGAYPGGIPPGGTYPGGYPGGYGYPGYGYGGGYPYGYSGYGYPGYGYGGGYIRFGY